jgi:hypothetical protein
MTDVSVGEWGVKPGAPVVLKKGRRSYRWPEFPIWYRTELSRNREKPTTFEDARTRKVTAEAELAEIELAKARAEMLTLSDLEAIVARDYSKVRAKLTALTGRLAPDVVGCKTTAEATAKIEPVIREAMEELSR